MQLQLNVKANKQTLEVRYATTNDTGVDVYVQHFVDHHAEPTCFVYHLRPHEVFLWAGTPPGPPLTSWAQPYYAHAERLPPGKSLDVTLRLALPLLESGMIDGPDPDEPHEPVWANSIRFRLDVQPMRPGLDIVEYKQLGTYLVQGLPPTMLEATTLVEPAFIVHRRSGDFHRGGLESDAPPF